MGTFNRYVALTKILTKDSFGLTKHTKQQNDVGVSKAKKALGKVGLAVVAVLVLIVMIVSTVSMTLSAENSGIVEEMVYGLIAAGQLIVLFFGTILALNTLYFNKDNPLLSSLPIEPSVVFSAKFTVTYLSELAFSALILVPIMTTAGVTLTIVGYAIPWFWYLIEIFAVIVTPVIPLVVVSLISMPLMFLVSYMRNKNTLKTIANLLVYGLSMVIYFAIMTLAQTTVDEESGMMTSGGIALFEGIKRATIFNYPLVNAMLGNNAGLNTLYYALGIIALLAVAIVVAGLLYKRALALQSEGGATTDKKKSNKTKKESIKLSIAKSLAIKEFRIILHNSTLLINALMGVFMPIIIGLIFSLSGVGDASMLGEEGMPYTFTVSIVTYAFFIVIGVSNPIAPIGFSLEGKNLAVLKSLPISAMDLIRAKLIVSNIFTLVTSISMGVIFPIAGDCLNVSVVIGLTLLMLVGGAGFNALMLKNDLSNPNTEWSNITEITKNNKRTMKPAMLAVCIGILFGAVGIILGLFLPEWSPTALYALFYGICLVPTSILCVIGYVKLLKNPEKAFRKIGG